VPQLLARVKAELGASFVSEKPLRISRAPGRLDVMGGIAGYTGSLVCEATIDRAAAVALQARDDRFVQIFSFNLFDLHKPFTAVVPLEALALPLDRLRQEFAQDGRHWASYLAGCLAILHDEKLVDLNDPATRGVNIALLSSVPAGVGVGSSAAVEVATMANLVEHYVGSGAWGLGLGQKMRVPSDQAPDPKPQALSPIRIAELCERVAKQIAGRPGAVMDQIASCAGEAGSLVRMLCQPHTLESPLQLPAGVQVIGINSSVQRSAGGTVQFGRTRSAAFMGHKIILDTIKKMGATAGREMIADPMNGYLANLPLNDYKKYFRSSLPETMKGGQFLLAHGSTIDKATPIEPDTIYHIQSATDHHVFEAHRVREFVRYLEAAGGVAPENSERKLVLDKAGHLMYASHISYTRDARQGADACDLLIDLARQRESAGIYGARITAAGSGGTVAVLCDEGESVDAAIAEILREYEAKTGVKPDAFLASSPGAWAAGTTLITS